MDGHKEQTTDEMKQFLQEGVNTYAPAALAMAEFRRQVRSQLQSVLDDSKSQFTELGIDLSALNYDSNFDDPDATSTSWFVGLRKDQGRLWGSYYLEWDSEGKEGQKLWVATNLWLKSRQSRIKLFDALRQHPVPLSFEIKQGDTGGSLITSYCDEREFYTFPETFRTLIEEWLALLTAIGGIQQFLTPVLPSESE